MSVAVVLRSPPAPAFTVPLASCTPVPDWPVMLPVIATLFVPLMEPPSLTPV